MHEDIKDIFPSLKQGISYLDNASTTQLYRPNFYNNLRANPKRGIYSTATQATINIAEARQQVATFIGAKSYQCIFVPSTSYALNLLAFAISKELNNSITTAIEHHSNYLPWLRFFKNSEVIATDKNGHLDLSCLKKSNQERVIALSAGSNVTGYIPNFNDLSHLDPNYDCIVLDATQYLAHKKLNVNDISISALAFSSHKLFALGGAGVLWLNDYWLERLEPPFWGGGMVAEPLNNPPTALKPPDNWELGSLPSEVINSLANSISWLQNIEHSSIIHLHKYLMEQLKAMDFISIYGGVNTDNRLPIISFNIKNLHAHDTAQALSEENICVRAGHHCAAPLMQSFGIDACVRVSLAPYNNLEDIHKLLDCLKRINGLIN